MINVDMVKFTPADAFIISLLKRLCRNRKERLKLYRTVVKPLERGLSDAGRDFIQEHFLKNDRR